MAKARLARVVPWDTLAALGRRVGVDELYQFAATVGLTAPKAQRSARRYGRGRQPCGPGN